MKLDEAKKLLADAHRAAGVKRALAKAASSTPPRRGRPRRTVPTQEVIRAAVLAGAGLSIAEIANALGGDATKAQTAKLLSRHPIPVLRKKSNETAAVVIVPKAALAKLGAIALSRDIEVSVLMAAALSALAEETVVLANLVDEDL